MFDTLLLEALEKNQEIDDLTSSFFNLINKQVKKIIKSLVKESDQHKNQDKLANQHDLSELKKKGLVSSF